MEIEKQLNAIEQKIRELKREYEMYFTGEARLPPEQKRIKVQKVLGRLSATHLTSTRMKFRLEAILSKFNAFQRLWDRIMLQIELGTYKGDQFRARIHATDAPPASREKKVVAKKPTSRAIREDEERTQERRLRDLHHTFVETRRVTRENADVSFGSFKQSLDKHRGTLVKKFGGDFNYEVVIEGGKAKVKGVSKK